MAEDYSEGTEHARRRSVERNFSINDVEVAVETASGAGQVKSQTGKYGTSQLVYVGTNGLTAVMEMGGSNAGKLITAWWRRT